MPALGADTYVHEICIHRIGASMRVGPPAMWIILVHESPQFLHVIQSDFLISTLPDS